MKTIKVYLAAPFFTPEQIAMVENLEAALAAYPIFEVFSPRKIGGVLKDMDPAERKARAQLVFESNVTGVHNADVVLAWVNGYDPGVMVELGIAYECGDIYIIGFTKNKGMNVMLACLMDTYCENFTELLSVITELSTGKFDAIKVKKGEVTT